ncbi:LHFPL tetraspan subfamily member 7 protein isoform X3 [Hyperolius riggenbachi]|uniref:LHFPL tetraspan subfamily member 7 protein isoform X3 n=1 Tax=Hyperolius riggenbachi TaxID=752182 RepID=UPI0035A2E697
MVSCMGSLWVALSFILSLILGFSLMSSAWFKNNDMSFGVFIQCSGQISSPCNQTCIVFRTLEEIPDLYWKIAAVILFAGWLLMSFGALLVLSWTVIPGGICQRRVCTPARYTQITAVSVTVLGLILFPLSLQSPFANRICESSYAYVSCVQFREECSHTSVCSSAYLSVKVVSSSVCLINGPDKIQ